LRAVRSIAPAQHIISTSGANFRSAVNPAPIRVASVSRAPLVEREVARDGIGGQHGSTLAQVRNAMVIDSPLGR
jgi:hypothetical protein